MASSNLYTPALTLLLITGLCTSGRAQCVSANCGNLTTSYETVSEQAVFCEGATVEFQNNTVDEVDFFVIDWQDGVIDTFYDKSNVSHQYNFAAPEEGQCNSPVVFEVLYEGFRGCDDDQQSCHFGRIGFSVNPKPVARMQVPNEVCVGRELQFNSESCNANTFLWDFGDGNTSTDEDPRHVYAGPGTYTIELTVTGSFPCDGVMDVIRQQVTIVTPPNSIFTVSDEDLIACESDTITFTNGSNNETDIEWSIDPENGWEFIDTNMTVNSEEISIIFNNDRDYTITLTGSNACDTEESEQTITIEEAPEVNQLMELTGCDEVMVSPSLLGYGVSGSFIEVCWEFPDGNASNVCSESFSPVTFTSPGMVRLIVRSLCGEITREAMVNVQSSAPPTLTAGSDYCTSSSPDTLRASSPGGEWDGPGIIDEDAGVFDPTVAGAGSHEITYEIRNGACNNMNSITINVTESAAVSSPDQELCRNGGTITLTATPTGGSWSGSGITNSTGTFDPDTADVGTARPVYTFDDGMCVVEYSPMIEVVAVPEIEARDSVLVCNENESVNLEGLTAISADPNGGNYMFTINGMPVGETFNPFEDLPGPGIYPIGYTYNDEPCTVNGMLTLEVLEKPVLVIDSLPILCENGDPVTLTANLSDGTWSGDGIIDGDAGLFAPDDAGTGVHTVSYDITEGTCRNAGTIDIRVVAGATVEASPAEFCLDSDAAALSATPPGGTWSGPGIIDQDAGTFEPDSAGVGTANPVYTFEDTDGCILTATPDVEVFAVPEVSSTDTALACLVNEAVELTVITGVGSNVIGGTYRWTVNGTELPGSTVNPVSDLPGPGVYPVTFIYENGPCTVPGGLFLEIIDNPQLALTPQDNVCISAGTLTLGANLSGGEWTGREIDPLTGEINLNDAGGGTFIYTYSFQPGGSCEQTAEQTLTIEDPGATIDAGLNDQACEDNELSVTLNGAEPGGGYWTGAGVTDSLAGTVDLTALVAGDTYEYTYNIESPTTPGCNASDTRLLVYDPAPDPNFSRDGSPCIDQTFSQAALQMGDVTYLWDLGDGTESDQRVINHTYTSGGTFTQTLTVTSREGCPADTTATVYVTTPPAPQFGLDSTLGCAPFVLTLNDQSSGDDFTSFWTVDADTFPGGGTQDVILDGFLEDTEVTIILTAENFCGARTQVQSIVVKPYPAVDFGFDTDDGCSLFVPEISNVTRGNPDRFFWDMGNGITGTDSLPPYVEYFTPDDSVSVYQVTLRALNECGLGILTKPITVHPPDVRAFIGLDTIAGCQPWMFEPRSFSTPGANLAWEVLAPDGTVFASGNDPNPGFELTQVGLHRVILRAERCGSDNDTTFVNVLPAPTVSFVTDPAVCRGDSLTLTNTSSGIAGGFYDLGDGMTTDQLNTTVVYDSSANYQISFTGLSALNNCPATVTRNLVVNDLPEIAIAATDSAGCIPLETAFSDVAGNGAGLSYNWDFGDGNNAVDVAAPAHSYQTPGEYFPTLTATDENGCKADTFLSRIIVHPDPVAAFVLADETPCARYDSLLITNISQGANDFAWTVSGTNYPGPPPTLALPTAGAQSINLLATSSFGCTDESSQELNVLPSPTAIAEVSPTALCLGESVSFGSASTGATGLNWNLGDATGRTEASFTHVYGQAGTYTVVLTASNNNGCPTDTTTAEVRVNPLPSAAYSFTESVLCGTPAEVSFTNNSSGALTFRWDFDDGATATTRDALHTYTTFGVYRPQLTVETEFGCIDTAVLELVVSGNPVADFELPPALACSPYLLTVEALPTEAIRYEWYLDDAFVPHVGLRFDTLLSEPNSHNIRLIAIYDNLCRDTLDVTEVIQLEARPVAGFTHEIDELPNRLGDVFFQSISSGGNEYWWDLGDGTTRTDPAFLHEYRINRDITVTHAITQRYDQGLVCSDTLREEIAPEWITKFFVPNAISPESGPDEVRTWGAKGFGVRAYTLEVYSSYGQLIFSTSELEESQPKGRWNGRWADQSDFVLQGAYTWRASVEYVDGNTENFVGTVTVIR